MKAKGLMISVLENGVNNEENCKLLDTYCFDVPMYRYLVRRIASEIEFSAS